MYEFCIGRYTYFAFPNFYYLHSNKHSDKDDIVKSYDQKLYESLDKIFRERCSSSSSSSQFKKFRSEPQQNTDWKSIIKPILEQEPVLSRHFSKVEFEKLSLLWIAVLGCYQQSAELLVRSGTDVNELFGHHDPQVIYKKCTILHLLFEMDPSPENERLIRLVTDHGADLQARNHRRKTVLHYAVERELSIQITEMLLEKGADVNAADDQAMTPLLFAVSNSKFDKLVPLLIKHGADLRARNQKGQTVLHHAVQNGRVQITEMLLEKGANVNAADNEGITPLFVAVANKNAIELVPLLIKHGADVFDKSNIGNNVLHHLALYNPVEGAQTELARVFIEKGISLDDKSVIEQYEPIHVATLHGNDELVKLYLDHGANVNALMRDDKSPLYLAVAYKKPKVLKTLIKRGANVDLKTSGGFTALHTACEFAAWTAKWESIIRLLLSAGADVLAENRIGKTPLALILSGVQVEPPGIRLLIKALAPQKALQSLTELKDERIIERHSTLQNYYQDCIEEIDRMKSTRFIETCSFFDLLTKNYRQIAKLMRNPNFETQFEKFDLNGFSNYAIEIRRAFKRAQKLYRAMLEQENVINEAVYNILPYLVVRKVVHYISFND